MGPDIDDLDELDGAQDRRAGDRRDRDAPEGAPAFACRRTARHGDSRRTDRADLAHHVQPARLVEAILIGVSRAEADDRPDQASEHDLAGVVLAQVEDVELLVGEARRRSGRRAGLGLLRKRVRGPEEQA